MENERRQKRHLGLRKKIQGTKLRPRAVVYRSAKHIYVSLVSDETQPNYVITSVSSLSREFKKFASEKIKGGNCAGAREVGALLAEKAKQLNIKEAIFDRAGYRYTGRLKSLVEAARKGGLKL